MKNKGFTLIELLAVIVILAIIALIAVPIILNIIDDSKKEAAERSAENYIHAVELAVARKNLNGEFNSSLCEIQNVDGVNKLMCGQDELKVDVDGSIPKEGWILIGEDKIKDYSLYIDNSTVEQVNGNFKVTVGKDVTNESLPKAYKIGDKLYFAGSDWYVIANSSEMKDYVTLMKAQILNDEELGEYAANIICNEELISYGWRGCETIGQEIKYSSMSYYWSDTCHSNGLYGYTEYDESGCAGHNDYEGSKVREFLEGTYINVLGSDNLKEVDGYKIRLIKAEEIENNLGWTGMTDFKDSEDVPEWVYSHNVYGSFANDTWSYWTMSKHPEGSYYLWEVRSKNDVGGNFIHGDSGVRPVINLKKSAIQQ